MYAWETWVVSYKYLGDRVETYVCLGDIVLSYK